MVRFFSHLYSKITIHCKPLQGKTCNENRVFPAKFSLLGKTCFYYLWFFPVKKTSQGKPCLQCSLNTKRKQTLSYYDLMDFQRRAAFNNVCNLMDFQRWAPFNPVTWWIFRGVHPFLVQLVWVPENPSKQGNPSSCTLIRCHLIGACHKILNFSITFLRTTFMGPTVV